jgi:hypothetical protein
MHKPQLNFFSAVSFLLSDVNFLSNLVVNIVFLCFSYQQAIEEITRQMGAGMAKFICKEVCDISPYQA